MPAKSVFFFNIDS